ncbi:ABC transporter permease [Halorarius litoreus]|uniref:ABC transporter permease n=1 Tax=Halorarius litoreus TaxID=2962676 RepID=UPI0020CEB85E|nr:ABC transporter permease [Halorarius litoreus]
MSRRLAIARRELASLSTEKTIVLALLIQLVVAAFSSFLVVGLTTLYDPSSVDGGGVTVGVSGDATDDLLDAVATQQSVNARVYGTPEDARDAFRAGAVDALAIATHEDGRIAVDVTAPDSSLRKTLIVVQLRETLETLERQERRERAQYLDRDLAPLPPDVDASPYFGFSYTVLLPLLLFLPTFISGSTAVDTLTEEIERGTLELLRVAPVSLRDIVDGKGLAMAVLAPVQAGAWILLLTANGIEVANVGPLLVVVTALTLVLVGTAVLLALVVPNRQRAQLLYSLGVLAVFAVAAFLPEHPATTVARLAIGSATETTFLLVAGYAVVGVLVTVAVRATVDRVDAEGL